MSRTLRRPRDSRGEEKSAARDRAAPPSPLESERASENIPMTTDLLALRALLCSFKLYGPEMESFDVLAFVFFWERKLNVGKYLAQVLY